MTAAFPGLQFNSDLFWATTNDLDGQYFLMAIMDVVKNTKDIYPGTNIIATIRGKAIDLQNKALQNSTLKLETETEKERIDRWQKESVPMPDECRKALAKLGINFANVA